MEEWHKWIIIELRKTILKNGIEMPNNKKKINNR